MTPEQIVSFATILASVVLSAAFLLTVYRVVVGPTLPDRIVALDMLVGIAIGFIAVIAIRTGFNLYVDIAIALGLVGFLATVAFARFVLSRGPDGRRRPAADPSASTIAWPTTTAASGSVRSRPISRSGSAWPSSAGRCGKARTSGSARPCGSRWTRWRSGRPPASRERMKGRWRWHRRPHWRKASSTPFAAHRGARAGHRPSRRGPCRPCP